MKKILHTVDVAKPPREVYRAISTEAGLRGWWTAIVEAEETQGGAINFTFGATFNPEMEITALEPERLVAWRCVGGHEPWQDNTFRFEIEPREAGCVLLFTQEYARELSDEEYGRYNFNWGYYLESLRMLVQTGRGRPYNAPTAEDLKAVVERFVEQYKNQHDADIVDELVAEDCAIHIPVPGLPQGREGMRVNHALVCGAFPDVHVERELFLADGDIVVERATAKATHRGELLGTPATGKPVTWTELHAYRVVEGQIREIWSEPDLLGILVQIGAFTPPDSGTGS